MSDRERRYDNRTPKNSSYKGNSRGPRSGGQRIYSGRSRSRNAVYLKQGSILYILDILQHGGIDKEGHSWHPICQVLEVDNFQLYEVLLNKKLIHERKLSEKIEYNEGEKRAFERINKRLSYDQLTPTSNQTITLVIEQYVKDNEARFIKFINNVGPITIKRHYLEVLPGVGKKLMQEILSSRNKKLFENFEGLHTRVPGFKPLEVFKKRILEELEENDLKHYLFVKKRKSDSGHSERPHSKKREGNQKNYGKNPRNPRYR